MKAWCMPLGSALLAWTLPFTGCQCGDGMIPTAQLVDIQLTDIASGQPVRGARITLNFAFVGDNEGVTQVNRQLEAANPDAFTGVRRETDENGEATLAVHFSTGCPPCSPAYDGATGRELWVNVETELASESVVVRATPGQFALGETFQVTVLAVGEPFLLTHDVE